MQPYRKHIPDRRSFPQRIFVKGGAVVVMGCRMRGIRRIIELISYRASDISKISQATRLTGRDNCINTSSAPRPFFLFLLPPQYPRYLSHLAGDLRRIHQYFAVVLARGWWQGLGCHITSHAIKPRVEILIAA